MDKSNYPRCRDCKWWGEEELFGFSGTYDFKPSFPVRYCDCPHMVHVQDQPDHYEKTAGDKSIEATSAFTSDGSNYTSGFHTGPDFGCVHWEAREKE